MEQLMKKMSDFNSGDLLLIKLDRTMILYGVVIGLDEIKKHKSQYDIFYVDDGWEGLTVKVCDIRDNVLHTKALIKIYPGKDYIIDHWDLSEYNENERQAIINATVRLNG